MRDLLHQYAVELAAVVGSLLGLRYVEDLSRATAAAGLATGILCAYFGTPIVMYLVSPPAAIAASAAGLTGLLLGFSGFALLAAWIKTLRKSGDAASESIPEAIRRWVGKLGGKDGSS